MPATIEYHEELLEIYPNGMTKADIEFELEARGVKGFSLRLYTREIIGDSVLPMQTELVVFNMAHLFWDRDRERRRQEILEQAGNASVVVLARNDDSQRRQIVHPSTRRPGKWQLSQLDSIGPVGHCDFDSFELALYSAVGAHPDSIEDRGNSDYVIVEAGGNRE